MRTVLLLLSLILPTLAWPATYYVRTNGTATSCVANTDTVGGSRNTIQAGINCATQSGDVVVVHAGTYGTGNTATNTLDGGPNNVTVRAAPGAVVWHRGTIGNWNESGSQGWTFDGINVDGTSKPQSRDAVLYIGSFGVIQNLEAKGAPYYGIGMAGNSTAINVKSHSHGRGGNSYCVGTNNHGQCHGFYGNNDNLTIRNSEAWNNDGNGFSSNGTGHVLSENKLHHNDASGIQLYGGAGDVSISNNVIYRNGTGIELRPGTYYNNTIAFNGNGVLFSPSGTTFLNNIFANNDTSITTSSGGNNLCWPSSATGCSTVANPLFVSLAGDDYHLQASSPAIDTGTALAGITTDKDGCARPVGSAPDRGAYEYGGANCSQTDPEPGAPNFTFTAQSPVQVGTATTLTWSTVTDATECTASMVSGTDTNWTGTSSSELLLAGGGLKESQPLDSSKTFRMSCTGNGTTTKDQTVTTSPVPTNIVLHCPFNEGEGLTSICTADDGSQHTATLNGDAQWVTGIVRDHAIQLSGAGYIEIPGHATFRPADRFGLIAWIRMSGGDSDGCEVVTYGDSYALNIGPQGQLGGFFYDGTNWPLNRSTTQVTTGVNTMVSVGYLSGDGIRLWKDTAQVGFLAASGTISYTLGPNIQIGRHGNGGTDRDCVGVIDEVRIMTRQPNQMDIDNFFNDDVSSIGKIAEISRYTRANRPQGEFISANNTDIPSHLVTVPIGIRTQVRVSSTSLTDHLPWECQVDLGGFTTITDAFGALNIRYLDDVQVSMGDIAPVLMDPVGGFTPVNGYVSAFPIDNQVVADLNSGEVAEFEGRFEFHPSLAGSMIQCRPAGLTSYGESTRGLCLAAPPKGLSVKGLRIQGVQ